ncbi:MAG: forespore capture DNA-binding protein RefZ [Bacillota bacterium]|nr:forespore capture DNA-binding protein RefZ [Bacillota bacterium]
MKKNSKEAIIQAAISLFTANGFDGTSIRDIANKAKVNVANISYYFQSKQGLLEYCFTTFFEEYLLKIEKGYASLDHGASFCLKQMSSVIIEFLCDNIQFTSFIFREMSIDSQTVREIMTTYYRKEKYFLQKVLEIGVESKEFRPQSISYIIVQLKGLWTMPFLNAPYLREVLYLFPNERYFAAKYTLEINKWIDEVLCVKKLA